MKILVLVNLGMGLFKFRKEFLEELIAQGHEVYISSPYDEFIPKLIKTGCKYIETPVDRRGSNPIKDFKLLSSYVKIMKKIKPDLVLTYTIKPNIYGGLAARVCNVKALHTVTGLGSVYIQKMWHRRFVIMLNRLSFKKAEAIFFLNQDNEICYKKIGIVNSKQETFIVAGSGVNLESFKYDELSLGNDITFTFIARVLKDKGIEEFLFAAKTIKKKHDSVKFNVVGFVEEEKYVNILNDYEQKEIITYLGKRDDIQEIMASSTCIVLPSYGEGRGTVLQEGAAVGRPLITCDTYGCRDNVEDNKNGYLCEVGSAESLANSFEKFINLSNEEKLKMGRYSRDKAEKEFDRNIVIKTYIDKINEISLTTKN